MNPRCLTSLQTSIDRIIYTRTPCLSMFINEEIRHCLVSIKHCVVLFKQRLQRHVVKEKEII